MTRRRSVALSGLAAVVIATAVVVAVAALSGNNRGGGGGGGGDGAPGFDRPLSPPAAGGQVRPGPGHTATPPSSLPTGGGPAAPPAAGGAAAGPAVADIGPSGASLVIAAIGVDAPLRPTGAVGAPETASLTIPDDIHTVAWWDGVVTDGNRTVQEAAPKPGQPGVAVIAGHIDSAVGGPGALYHAKSLKVGDTVQIVDSAGHTTNWAVSAPPQTALKTALPASLWVTTGPPKLALVTCGGPFDAATGHYVDNVIVWAAPTTV